MSSLSYLVSVSVELFVDVGGYCLVPKKNPSTTLVFTVVVDEYIDSVNGISGLIDSEVEAVDSEAGISTVL